MSFKDKIIDSLTKEDILDIMNSFGAFGESTPTNDLVFPAMCHDSNKKKLYYYEFNDEGEVNKHFMCYSRCGGMSIFTTFMQIKNWSFNECLTFLAEYKNISIIQKKERGFNTKKEVIDDWDFISKYKKKEKIGIVQLPILSEHLLYYFDNIYPSSWEGEGITQTAMKKFGIQFYVNEFKAVIPHRDYKGHLVGIRGRSFLERDVENGKKYMPIYIEGESRRHPLHYNLYGLYENMKTIKRLKKVMLVEGEKGVLLCESYYPNDNFAVAMCGMNLSNYLRDLLLNECDIKEVIIALDKQYKTNLETEKEKKEYEKYIEKVTRIADKFVNYIDVNIIYCDDDLLDYKDAPVDKGKGVLEQLMKEKIRYEPERKE